MGDQGQILRNAIVKEFVYDDIAKLCAAKNTYLEFPLAVICP
jgi:hypothetical protein